MLNEILENNQCFKLICGAGNEDTEEVEKLVYLYSLSGCNFFDVCAKEKVVLAAKRGLERAGIKDNRFICISVGSESDQHFCKAEINKNDCINCGKCEKICPQGAIDYVENRYKINKIKCIGCKRCIKNCPNECIELIKSKTDFNEVLPSLINLGLDCIEFHISGDENFKKGWKEINTLFDGMLSISINRAKLGDEKLVKTIKKLIKKRKPYSTIIQADGIPMSGGKDTFHSTLQAVAVADVFKNANLEAYIISSGGTNSKTSELAKLCNVNLNGVAIGSYARKIVQEFIKEKDFFENKVLLNKALKVSKNLVNTSLEYLK